MTPSDPDSIQREFTRRAALLRWVALSVFLFGVGWRLVHIVYLHPATQYVYSDMQGYHTQAERWARGDKLNIVDTLYPPGASLWYAAWHRLDHRDRLTSVVMALASALVPLFIGWATRRFYGRQAGWVALILASLYFPYIDYFAFFLSEGPFIFFCYLFFILFAMGVNRPPARARGWMLGSGIFLGVATSMRTVGLAWALGLGLFLLWRVWRSRHSTALRPELLRVVAFAVGFTVVLVPLAVRCTVLDEGHFCAVSTNGPMNVLLGHMPDARSIHWVDNSHNTVFVFGSPVMTQMGATQDTTVNFGAYDGPANMRYALHLLARDPAQFLWLSIDQAAFLFGGTIPWPSSHTPWRRAIILSQYAFYLTILLPALFTLRRRGRALFSAASEREILLMLPLVLACATSFLTLGEPRYRIPCDGFLMMLAAVELSAWLGLGETPPGSPAKIPQKSIDSVA